MNERVRRNADPLFGLIDQYPVGNRKASRELESLAPFRTVATADSMLARFGVPNTFLHEHQQAAEPLSPLGRLVLWRKPKKDETDSFEGRGNYQTVPLYIPGEPDRTVIVYSKGSGNHEIFEKENVRTAPFPGYPKTTNNLYYDDITIDTAPRILGALSVTEGLSEMMNASAILAYQIKKHGWQHLHEPLDAGMTVPLQVTEFPRLSSHFRDLMGTVFDTAKDPKAQEATLWEPNLLGQGTVTMVVPGQKRIYDPTHEKPKEQTYTNWRDEQTIGDIASTVHDLLDCGFVYLSSSSRGHNLYQIGKMKQADNADLLFLPDIEVPDTWQSGQIHKFLLQAFLVYEQFAKRSFLSPPTQIDKRYGYGYEDMQAAQKQFWNTVLGERMQPGVDETIATLMPFMHTELNMALAIYIMQGRDTALLEEIGSGREAVMDDCAEYKLRETTQRKIEKAAFNPDYLNFVDVSESEKLPVAALVNYLKSGDTAILYDDPRVSEIYFLGKAIGQIEDKDRREQIFGKTVSLLSRRSLRSISSEPDIIASFAGEHLQLITDAIEGGHFDTAEQFLDVLSVCSQKKFKDAVNVYPPYEPPQTFFPKLLLSQDTNEVFQQCMFLYNLKEYADKAAPTPEIADVFYSAFAIYRNYHNVRDNFANLFETYDELEALKRRGAKSEMMRRRIDGYAPLGITDADQLRPLAAFQTCMLAYIFDGIDDSFVRAKKEEVKDSLENLQLNYMNLLRNKAKKAYPVVAESYREMGYPLVARRFDVMASGEKDADMWNTEEAA